MDRLWEFANGSFHCHKTGDCVEDDEGSSDFVANDNSSACAGALIFLEKRGQSSQMTRIAGRLGLYDPDKLNMKANVR